MTNAAQMIGEGALDALKAAAIDGNKVILAGQLDPDVYAEVDTVLRRLGGKYRPGKKRAHLFEEDAAPLVAAVVASGEFPPKNPLSFFATQPAEVDLIIAHGALDLLTSEDWLLEPSAGRGAIAGALARGTEDIPDLAERLVCVELDPLNARVLRAKGLRHVVEADFLGYSTERRFRRVFANPPFSAAGDALYYASHVYHMWSLTADGGKLLSIVPENFLYRADERAREFRAFVHEHGYYVRLPKGAFRRSGADVTTVLVVLDRLSERERRELETSPYDGYLNYYAYTVDVYRRQTYVHWQTTTAIFERIERGELPPAPVGRTLAEIEALFGKCVEELREQEGHVHVTAETRAHLVETFMEGYAEWAEERAQGYGSEDRLAA